MYNQLMMNVDMYLYISGENVCGQDNGGCSHICFPVPESYDAPSTTSECMCPDYLWMADDNKTCYTIGNFSTTNIYHLPCCDVCYYFHIKTMFGSSLPPVVCSSARVLFTLFVFVCIQWCPTHIVLGLCVVVFVLCLLYPILPVSLDCLFLIALSVFFNV